jgi:hypothetical protein
MENNSSTEAKQDGNKLSNVASMHLENDTDQMGQRGRVTTLNELVVHNDLMSAFIQKYDVLFYCHSRPDIVYIYILHMELLLSTTKNRL